MTKQTNKMTLVDLETGLIFENVKSVTTEKQEDYLKKSREIQRERQEFVDNYGNFYFLKYKSNKTYEEDVLDSDSARIIFLASYMDYDGKLKFDDGTLIRKQDLAQLLKISPNKFYELYKRLTGINLLVMNEDKSLSLNSNKFIKGKIKTKDEYTRLFIHAVRTLYENCGSREYESLGLVYRLIPYVNYKHNILCTNPHEKDVDKIEALTFADISTIFGYVKTRASDVVNILSKFGIIDDYYGKLHIFGYIGVDLDISNSKIKVNPLLMYSGLNVDMDDIVLSFTKNTRAIEQRKNSKNVKALNGLSFEQNKLNNKNKKNKQNI